MRESAADARGGLHSGAGHGAGIYWSQAHSLAFDRLGFAATSRAPLTVFTGASGSGRTTLLRELVARNKADMTFGMPRDPDELAANPVAAVLRAFGRPQPPAPEEYLRAELARLLDSAAASGPTPVLLIDDADRLPDETLRALCQLVETGSDSRPKLKLILVGCPELFEWLYKNLRIPVGPAFELTAMSAEDTAAYVHHLLTAARVRPGIFDDEALDEIHRRTGGVPLKINAVCEGCLSGAPEKDPAWIGRDLVRRTVIMHGMRGLIHKMDHEEGAPDPPIGTSAPDQPAPVIAPRPQRPSQPGAASAAKGAATGPEETEDRRQRGAPLARALRAMKKAPGTVFFVGATAQQADRSGTASGVRAARPLLGVRPFDGLRRRKPPQPAGPPDPGHAPADARAAPRGEARREPGWSAADLLRVGFGAALGLAASGVVLWPARDDGFGAGVAAAKQKLAAFIAAAPEPRPPDGGPITIEVAPRSDLDRLARIGAAVAGFPVTADARFRRAIETAGDDAEVAIVGYARAALVGHEHAALYLAQIYGAGEGIPVDRALARAWYKQAGPGDGGTARLLENLPPPETGGTLAAPIQLFGAREPSGSVELVWMSGEGPDPASYRVELADGAGAVAMTAQALPLSALRMTAPDGARFWRVVAMGANQAVEAASPWLPIRED